MLSLEMLDVTIGIILVFLLLSLVCTALNELVESILKLRSVDLEQGIRELLNDPRGETFVKKIYDHPLVFSLFRGKYDPAEIRIKATGKDTRYSRGSDLPSYIPSKNFALALMDVLLPAKSATPGSPAESGGAEGAVAPVSAGVPASVTPGVPTAPVVQNPLQPLRTAVDALTTNDHVKKALQTILDAAGNDASKAREGIENWYNSSMDRVAGWYKRRVHTIVLLMGFGIAIVINADTFAIFRSLANDRPLRSAIVAQAGTIKEREADSSVTPSENVRKKINSLLELGLPIGWSWKSELNQGADVVPNFNAIPPASSFPSWVFKLFGWFVTGLAISLGAPFWFDILNKVMVVRSTVKPTEKSPDESSEDKKS